MNYSLKRHLTLGVNVCKFTRDYQSQYSVRSAAKGAAAPGGTAAATSSFFKISGETKTAKASDSAAISMNRQHDEIEVCGTADGGGAKV